MCGASFSARYAAQLGLDPREALADIISDLGIKALRLPVYWDEVEPEPGVFRWDSVDWQMEAAAGGGARVVLAVGHKVPRFPEYHAPVWATQADEQQFRSALARFVSGVVTRYRSHPALEAWQVENEPLAAFAGWRFGENSRDATRCLPGEIGLVRSLDRSRPIVLTYADTPWMAAQLQKTLRFDSDIVAVSVYSRLYFRSTFYTGYVDLTRFGMFAPLSLRYQKQLAARRGRELWAGELQAEPWPADLQGLLSASPEEVARTMSAVHLAGIWERVADAGIDRAYLWGVEWLLYRRKMGLDQETVDLVRVLAAGGPAP